MTDLDAAIGRAWRDDTSWELLTELTAREHRMAGHPGEHRAADLVRDAFETAGLHDVRTDEFPVHRWNRGTSELSLTAPFERAFKTIALPYSPAGEVSADLVDVGYGTPEEFDELDVEGKVVVTSTTTPESYGRFVHRMEKYGHAVEAGAAAFVFANHKPGQLPPTGSLRFDGEGAIPAVGVSLEAGEWLTEHAGDGAEVTVAVEAETVDGTSPNVHGTLGPEGDDEVVVVAHLDAHDVAEGALDNGCGVATLVGTARLLAELEPDLDARVRLAAVGAEEVGLHGAAALADDLDLDRVRAVVNLDGAGRYRDLRPLTQTSETLTEIIERVAGEHDYPAATRKAPSPYSDHWPFVDEGVPAVQLHSQSGERGRGWGHTEGDTRDKTDPRNLREHAILVALLCRELASTDDIPRVDDDELREGLVEQKMERGMRAADIWPERWE